MNMIKVAILEYEKETKDIVFQLSKLFVNEDWCFRHYLKASDLAKRMEEEEYQLFIFDEMFKNARMESVFVHDNPNAIVIYVCENPIKTRSDDERSRVFYISKANIASDISAYDQMIRSQCIQGDVYEFNYDGVHMNFAYEDIYYLEKNEKMVYFYTKKGVFHKRDSMNALEDIFKEFGFLRVHVSYIVNSKYIVAWYKDEVELTNKVLIPVSRGKKRKISMK